MKDLKLFLRIVGVLVIGILLVKMTYQSKYSVFMFDMIIFGILSVIGLAFLIWSLIVDLKQYQAHKRLLSLTPLSLGVGFIAVLTIWNIKISADFNKPTLVRIFYNGDYNGAGIDFKKDGTYIFDNSAIGLSNYLYGEYKIDGNKIMIDRDKLDKVLKTSHLEIRSKTIDYTDRTEVEEYAFQVDENGNILEGEIEFRVIIDNRK